MSYFKYGDRDKPENRGRQWETRAEEIKDRDDHTCQSCGARIAAPHTHHIIKGRHLPVGNARVWSNLVTVCRSCHNDLEGLPPVVQFRRIAQQGGTRASTSSDIADVIEALQTGWRRKKELRETLNISKSHLDAILSNLVPMGSVIKNDQSQYRAPIAEVQRAEREFAERKVEELEWKNDHLQSVHEDYQDRVDELECEIEELEREREEEVKELKNAVASLESAIIEIDAQRPVLREVKNAIRDAKSSVESVEGVKEEEEDPTWEEEVEDLGIEL